MPSGTLGTRIARVEKFCLVFHSRIFRSPKKVSDPDCTDLQSFVC